MEAVYKDQYSSNLYDHKVLEETSRFFSDNSTSK